MPEWIRRWGWELLLAGILVAVLIVNVSLSPFYLSVQNVINSFQLSIEKVIVAVMMTFVIVNGEIDLSVAAVMAFSASVLAALHASGAPFGLAVGLALLAGAGAGLFQGFFVARMGLPSLTVTLAGLIGFRGAARILVEDESIGDFPEWFDRLGQDALIGRLTFGILLFLIGIAMAGVVLQRTPFGRSLYVIGDNAEVARFSGINVARTKLMVMTSSGLVAGLAGVHYAARLGSVRGDLAQGFELDIITMVLLGGVSIFGGSGNLVGVGLSMLIILNIRNGLGLARVAITTQVGVIGALLILSVLVPNVASRLARRRHRESAPGPPSVAGHRQGGDVRVGERGSQATVE